MLDNIWIESSGELKTTTSMAETVKTFISKRIKDIHFSNNKFIVTFDDYEGKIYFERD